MPNAIYYADRNFVVQFPAQEIWFPPLQLLNTASNGKKIEILENTLVNIDQEGTVSALLYYQLASDCDLNFELYAEHE